MTHAEKEEKKKNKMSKVMQIGQIINRKQNLQDTSNWYLWLSDKWDRRDGEAQTQMVALNLD